MLYNFFLLNSFVKFCQSGFYIDFFLKKLTEVFVRNLFIYTAQFFAEKYLIEYFTKNFIVVFIFCVNSIFGVTRLSFTTFFFSFLFFLLSSIIFLNVYLLYIM